MSLKYFTRSGLIAATILALAVRLVRWARRRASRSMLVRCRSSTARLGM